MTPTQTLILRRLRRGPATTRDVVPSVNLTTYAVRRVLNQLREQGLVHIHSWVTSQRPLWEIGQGQDAPRPAPLSAKQYAADYRMRHLEEVRRRQREWWQAVKPRKRRSKSQESKSSQESTESPTATAAQESTSI